MTENITDLVDRKVRESELSRQQLQEEGLLPPHVPAHSRVITISRELGSGGRRVAEALSARLKFSIWDKEIVEGIADSANVSDHLVRYFDEHAVSEIEVLVRHLAGEPRIGGFQYKRHLVRTILQVGRIGSVIVLGRGANFVLPHALNVRVVASRDLRIHNLIEFERLSQKDAIHQIEESDRQRAEFTRRMWGRDWADPMYYDLVIRMDEITNEQAADIIAHAFRTRTVEKTG